MSSIELSRKHRFLGVVLFESSGPAEDPWHTEETVIVKAADDAEARTKIRAWSEAQCVTQGMPNGGEWKTRVIGTTAIFPMLFDVSDDGVTPLRVRQIADMEALRRADHRIDAQLLRAQGEDASMRARELAETLSEGVNFIAFLRALPEGKAIGQQRAHLVLTMDELARALEGVVGHPSISEQTVAAVRELRDAVSGADGELVTREMHAIAARALAAFVPAQK